MPFHFEKLLMLGVYREELMRACRRIKQPVQEPLTEALGELLWMREREAFEQARIDCVLSVPRHWTGRLLHHHNPSETLARFSIAENPPHAEAVQLASQSAEN